MNAISEAVPFCAQEWLKKFQVNRLQRLEIPWERDIELADAVRGPLVRSLQRFQVGEQGDGKHLFAGVARTQDAVYEEAMRLFIQEEQEHSRLLAKIIELLGEKLLSSHWSDTCFVFLRRTMGLRLELSVLLVAETIAQVYYRVLYENIEDKTIKIICQQIIEDEETHVRFHCSYLRGILRGWTGFLMRGIWDLFHMCVCLLVTYDHKDILKATKTSKGDFWRQCRQTFQAAQQLIFA